MLAGGHITSSRSPLIIAVLVPLTCGAFSRRPLTTLRIGVALGAVVLPLLLWLGPPGGQVRWEDQGNVAINSGERLASNRIGLALVAETPLGRGLEASAEEVALSLARSLTARGHAVDVLATTGRRGGRWQLAERTVEGIAGTVREAPFVGQYDLLDGGGASAPLPVRAAHHAMQARAAGWERLAREALRRVQPNVVHTLHDYQLLCARTTLLRSRGSLCDAPPLPCRLLARAKLAATAGVVIVTTPARFTLERHLASGAFVNARATVVRNAPEPPPALPPDRPDEPARGLFMGQLHVHKGVRELLAAAARRRRSWCCRRAGTRWRH
jgi:hypothetical protein